MLKTLLDRTGGIRMGKLIVIAVGIYIGVLVGTDKATAIEGIIALILLDAGYSLDLILSELRSLKRGY